MTFDYDHVNFGIVRPGATNAFSLTSDIFAGRASLTATITSDTSGGRFKVTKVTSYLATMGFDTSGEGAGEGVKPRPGRHKTIQLGKQVGQSDGTTPLPVTKGEAVVVDVEFIAPAQSTDTARTATLEVQGDKIPAKVPLTALVADISIKMQSISVVQGRTVDVPVTVESLAGPPTTVTLSTDPPWPGVDFALSASSVSVSHGSAGSATLHFAAERGATAGTFGLHMYASAYDGTFRTNWSFLFSASIRIPTLRPSPIDRKYAALGGAGSFLGPPAAPEAFCSDYIGQFRPYQNGVIYWSGSDGSGAFEIHGPILAFLGGDKNPASACSTYDGLGYPTTDVVSVPFFVGAIYMSRFQRGGIYEKPNTGMRIVGEPLFNTYIQLGETRGSLGFPIAAGPQLADRTHWFQDFENQGLFGTANGPAEVLSMNTHGIFQNVFPKEFVLNKVNAVLDDVVANYNKTADHQLSMQGGPRFQDSQNPVTDYSLDANGVTRNRQYRIQQDFFVSGGICPDVTISLSFDLLFSLGGSMSGGRDINGNPTGWTRQSILVSITNASANVDKHGNPLVTDSQVQRAHDQAVALATKSSSAVSLPALPGDKSYLSVKVLTDGSLAVLFEPFGG